MIELAKATPDIETLKLVLWIATSIIGILLLIVGFYIRKSYSGQAEQFEKISEMVDTLSETVNSLKTVVEVIKRQQEERDPRTEIRLNEHSKRLSVLEKEYTKLDTVCRFNHPRKNEN
jgi:cell shape-determining protein MreC